MPKNKVFGQAGGGGSGRKTETFKKCTPVGKMHLFATHCNGALCDIVKMQIQN